MIFTPKHTNSHFFDTSLKILTPALLVVAGDKYEVCHCVVMSCQSRCMYAVEGGKLSRKFGQTKELRCAAYQIDYCKLVLTNSFLLRFSMVTYHW